MSDRVDRCETCRFWDGDFCRRLPPPIDIFNAVALAINARDEMKAEGIYEYDEDSTPYSFYLRGEPTDGAFPRVSEEDWCGEWQPAKQPANVITIYYLQ